MTRIPHDPYSHSDIPAFCDINPENARRQIDLEIQKLEDTLRSLRSRRNEFAPISCLPPELLSQIFIFCASAIDAPGKLLDWVRVSHVSRHWRATAIECPSLWASIVPACPKWTEEMLKRSKMTRLVVDVNLSNRLYITPKVLESIRLTLQHIARIKDLKILATSRMVEELLTNLPIDAPLLQSLSFSTLPSVQFGVEEKFTLPEKLFSGDTSHLQRLELNKCDLIWNSPLFNGLTILKLCNPVIRPTTSQLMDVLEKMPALESLHFEEALPSVANEATLIKPADRIVSLSRLSHISVISSVPECANLFNHITFPLDITYSLRTRATESTGHDFSTIFNAISNSKASIRTLHILFKHPAAILIQGWLDNGNIDSRGMRRDVPDVELSLSWQRHDIDVSETVMMAACNVFSLDHLEGLYLSHIDDINPKAWITLFGRLTKIRLVHLAAGSTHAFVSALKQEPISDGKAQLTASQKKSGIPPICFSNLQTLTMRDVDFDTEYFGYLRDCLMERRERKAELRELCFKSCRYPIGDTMKLLREVVIDVDIISWLSELS